MGDRRHRAADISYDAKHRSICKPRQSEGSPNFVGKLVRSGCLMLSLCALRCQGATAAGVGIANDLRVLTMGIHQLPAGMSLTAALTLLLCVEGARAQT